MRRFRLATLALPLVLLAACNRSATPDNSGGGTPPGPNTDPAQPRLHIGYVLHGLNDFTAVIKRGAEDAGKDLGVDVEVTGPAEFKATDAIGMFEGMVQKKKDAAVARVTASSALVGYLSKASCWSSVENGIRSGERTSPRTW